MKRLTIALIVGLLGVQISYAQPQTILTKNVYFEQLPIDLGLSQRSINCILQDHEGYLWIGTWSGLIKYDGYSTKLFRADNNTPGKLKSNKIIRIFESRDSTLWVATRSGGLFRKDKVTDDFYQYTYDENQKNGLSSPHVWDIVEDQNGGLWIGTENGLNHLDLETGQFQTYYTDPLDTMTITNNFINRLMIDSRNRLWVATEYGVSMLSKIDSSEPKFQRITYEEDSANKGLHNYVYDLSYVETAQGMTVYWVTKKGLKKFSQGQVQNFEMSQRVSSFNIFRSMEMVSSSEPFLLLGSEMGLSIFDIKRDSFDRFFGDFDKEVNLSQNTITALTVDKSGVLWAGTKKGLNKYDTYDNNIGLYKTKGFDPTNSIITGFREAPDGKYWLSTMGGGLYLVNFDGDALTSIDRYKVKTNDDVDFTNYIQKLNIDREGKLWLGTAGAGVYFFDPKNIAPGERLITNYQHLDLETSVAISDDYVMSLCEANSGGMWVGTWSKGLTLIVNPSEVVIFDDPELKSLSMVSLFEDPAGHLWIGTRGDGIVKLTFQDKKVIDFQHYKYSQDQSRLNNNFINTIFLDSHLRLWVGAEDGLSLYNEKEDRFILVNEKQSRLPRDIVGIVEDDAGQLWLAGYEGITVINPDKDQMFVNHLDTQDRIQGGFFFNEVNIQTRRGTLIFGGSNGFNLINPKNMYQNPHLPLVVIKEITVSDVSLQPGIELNGREILTLPISQTDEIILNHDENTVSFEFAALSYANPSKNRYSYRLEGFDNDWQYTDANRRFAKYTNLDAGTYSFTVKGSNDDGLWNETGRTIIVTITPPWWKTQRAIVMYVILAILFLIAFRKLILVRTTYEHDLKFERIERENTERLNKSRLQFFTNISHEFRTPLTLILGLIEQLIDTGEGGVQIQRQLKLVSQNAGRLQRLISQLLDFRKAESGSLSLRVAEGNFYKFVKEIKLSFDSLAYQKGITYNLVTSSNVVKLYFDRDQFEKILFNLLSNAFKHTKEGHSITVELQELENHVSLSVIDEGDGISEADISKVFDRFYSGEQDSGTGSGIGLALCKSLVELHHGEILVESQLDKGSKFEVRIPKGAENYQPSEIIANFKDSENIDLYYSHEQEHLTDEVMSEVSTVRTDVSTLKKVLLVEDNTEVRNFLKSIFQYDYAVFEAENGQQGLELADEMDPDIVISDVMMPVMDGITLCEKMKGNLSTSHIPIILLTARTSFIYNIEGLEKGADDYVTKPFQIQVLKLKVRNLIKSREQSRILVRDKDQLVLEPKMVTVTSADETFIQKCIDLIEENMDNSEYTVVEFGKEIGLSRMQLYRKLKALTGMSPNEFIRMMRIKRAAQLFEHGDFNVSEVTYQVGFSDPAYFRKCFKEQFGATPSNYIKNKKGS